MTAPTPRRATWLKALALVTAAGLALRLPYLLLLPHLTDESVEVRHAYDIAFQGARPLTHADAYYGPLWPYLLAVLMRVVGPSLELPRLFSLAFGVATLGLTFALGARLARPGRELATATLAAFLLTVNFTHALVLSRVAWANSSSPFWGTATALALLAARQRPDRLARWAVAGTLAGLTLHTHPSLLLLLLALGLWLVLPRPRGLLTTRGPWLAVGMAILAYSPMLVYNLLAGFATFSEAGASTNASTGFQSLFGWPGRAVEMVTQLGRSLWGGWRLVVHDGAVTNVDPAPLVSGLLGAAAIVAVVQLTRRRDGTKASEASDAARRLPAFVLAMAAIGLPLVNRSWSGLLEARYLGYLLPFACVALADGLLGLGWASISPHGRGRPGLRRAVSSAFIALLVIAPIWSLRTYQGQALAVELDNRRLIRMADIAVSAERTDPALPVLVDRDLKDVAWAAGGNPRRAVEYVLLMRGSLFEVDASDKINYYLANHTLSLLFLAGPTAANLGTGYELQAVDDRQRAWEGAWGLFRYSGASPDQ